MIHVSYRSALPFWLSERARKAFQLANQEAHRLHHRAVGTEHLLLGLAKEGISPAAWALRFSGFSLTWLRSQVGRRRSRAVDDDETLPSALPYATDLASFIAKIRAEPTRPALNVSPQRLLVELVREPRSRVSGILAERKISWWLLRWLLRKVPHAGSPER
jgi:ATP-dependent Clp protease ATP-binding subunit ClpC